MKTESLVYKMKSESNFTGDYGSFYKMTKDDYEAIPSGQKAILGCQNCVLVTQNGKTGWLTVEVI